MKRLLVILSLLTILLVSLTGCGNGVIEKKDYDKYLVLEQRFTYENNWLSSSVDIDIFGANPSNKNVSYKIKVTAYDENNKEVSSTEATGVAFKNSRVFIKAHLKEGNAGFNAPNISYEITELKLAETD